MKLRLTHITSILLLAASLGIAGCASGNNTAADNPDRMSVMEDSELQSRVYNAIRGDAAFIGARIRVNVDQGIVRLRGKVENRRDIRSLERIVRDIDGVKGIDMRLEVKDSDRSNLLDN